MDSQIDKKKALKRMSELLRSGATMLAEKCPVQGCTMPLFRLRSGEVLCPVHGKVYMVKSDEEAKEVATRVSTAKVLDTLESRIIGILERASREPEAIGYREIIGWLEVLERIRRIKKELSP